MNRSGNEPLTESSPVSCFTELDRITVHHLSRPSQRPASGRPRETDQATGPTPVLLLHGWPQNSEMWRPIIAGLPAERRIEAPDLRGFGRTTAPGHGYDADTFAADQVALLDRLGIESAHVVGHDWGGWTAFLLALSAPERIASITVINAPHPWPRLWPPPATQIPRSWYAMALSIPGLGRRLLSTGRLTRQMLSWGSNGALDSVAIESYVSAFTSPERADVVTHLYRYYLKAFTRAGSGQWRDRHLLVPAQILFGERDRMIDSRIVHHGFREHGGTGIELFPDYGHFLPDEAPEVVTDRAVRFWDVAESA